MKFYTLFFFLFLLLNVCFGQTNSKIRNAEIQLKNANYNKAISLFTEIIESNIPTHKYESYYGRAYCYYLLKQDINAKYDIKKALRVKKKKENYKEIKGNTYWLYSLILSRNKTSKKSLKMLKKSSRFNSSSLLYSTIGFEEIYLGRYNDAIKSLNTSINLDANNAWAYSNKALALLKLKKYNLARINIETSIEMDNKNPYAFKHSAMIYIAIGNLNSACLELDKASKLNTSTRMADHKLDEIMLLKKEYCKKD